MSKRREMTLEEKGVRSLDELHPDRPKRQGVSPAVTEFAALQEVERLRAVLQEIWELDPGRDSDEGYNEWGEADCFRQAQEKARAAIAKSKESTT